MLGPSSAGTIAPSHDRAGTRFWGLALRVEDLDETVRLLGDRAGEIRPAVQRGRRIASLRRAAGLTVPLAFMSAAPAI